MTNRKIRDTVFCHFMSNESHLLSLCNALNNTGYDESSDITINTLEGSFFSNIKNDISFLLNNLMVVLIEHQTTINPNMPLRFLSYVDELYKRYTSTSHKKIYGGNLIKIPAPEFYVFYDGNDTSFEQQTLKLSDAFEIQSDKLELTVHVYNLADGMNDELKRKCLPIEEYSIFSNAYKHFRQQKMKIDHAVDAAIKYCLENNVMVEYLKNNQKEVIDMFGFEWNEKEAQEALIKTGEARGKLEGKREGLLEGKTKATTLNIKNLMKNMHLSPEDAMKALGIAPSEFSRYLALL
mgnify:FL=1